jgi:hypothetical protein
MTIAEQRFMESVPCELRRIANALEVQNLIGTINLIKKEIPSHNVRREINMLLKKQEINFRITKE